MRSRSTARVYGALGGLGLTAVGVAAALLAGGLGADRRGEPAVELGTPALPEPIGAEEAAARLARAGLITAGEQARLVRIGGEFGWAVFQTPGAPGPGERILLVALREGGTRFADALAHTSEDGGLSWGDKPGAAAGAGEGFVFDLGSHAAGTALQVALRLSDEQRELWLNHAGQDYRVPVVAPAALEWVGALELAQDGVPRAPGEPLWARHDLEVRVQTWPASPETRVVAHYRIGEGEPREAPLRLVATGAGEHRNNLQWEARLPVAELPLGSRVTWSVEASAAGAVRREDRGGEGWSAEVSLEPPAATWAAAGEYWWEPREAGFRDLPDPWVLAPGQLDSGGGPLPAIELYVPGITDQPDPARIAAGGFLRVEAYSPFFSGRPDGEWRGAPLVFSEKVGNNWRLRWNLLRAHEGTEGPEGLAPLAGEVAEADYSFKFRVSTDGGRSWLWLGTGGFPWGGENRTLRFGGARRWSAPALLGETRIPPAPVGGRGHQRLELLNDSPDPQRLSSLHLWGPAAFSAAVEGCSTLADCSLLLAPGERRAVDVWFAPEAKAKRLEAVFGARVEGSPNPDATYGRVSAKLSASAY